MSHYHAHPNGYLTIDNDPTPALEVTVSWEDWPDHPARITQLAILSELASDGNKAREWAERAAAIVDAFDMPGVIPSFASWLGPPLAGLLREMAEYHRKGEES